MQGPLGRFVDFLKDPAISAEAKVFKMGCMVFDTLKGPISLGPQEVATLLGLQGDLGELSGQVESIDTGLDLATVVARDSGQAALEGKESEPAGAATWKDFECLVLNLGSEALRFYCALMADPELTHAQVAALRKLSPKFLEKATVELKAVGLLNGHEKGAALPSELKQVADKPTKACKKTKQQERAEFRPNMGEQKIKSLHQLDSHLAAFPDNNFRATVREFIGLALQARRHGMAPNLVSSIIGDITYAVKNYGEDFTYEALRTQIRKTDYTWGDRNLTAYFMKIAKNKSQEAEAGTNGSGSFSIRSGRTETFNSEATAAALASAELEQNVQAANRDKQMQLTPAPAGGGEHSLRV
jgi:hypothetical protein